MPVSLKKPAPFSSNQLSLPPPFWWLIVVFLMFFYRHLIAGGKALFLLSSPVVAILSLPCSPLPPSPLLLDLIRWCVAPVAIDLACNDLTTFILFDRASIAAAAATVSAQQVFSTSFFGDSPCTCWARIWSTVSTSEYTFALMEAGIESLVPWFAPHGRKKRAAFLAQSSTILQRHDEELASANTENGLQEQCAPGKGKQYGKATLSGPASQDYREQISNGMSQQTIHNSTVDTELTINVGNRVAKIRKFKIIELL
jgi:hypothetical protein